MSRRRRHAGGGNRRALAQAVITLGTTLAVRTIAEGIELPQQLERLRELGCDLGQGFHFSRPLPAPQLEALLFSNGRHGAPAFANAAGNGNGGRALSVGAPL